MICFSIYAVSQSARVKVLEDKVYYLNNAFKYDSSKYLLVEFLNQPKTTNEEKYYANLFLSYVHKRLFDYTNTLKYLDEALKFGIQSPGKEYYINNIKCQKALALFDMLKYKEAGELMADLSTDNYKYIDSEYQAKIIMQEAYLLFLKNDYIAADKKYDNALEKMKLSSPCDLPMIYGKKIELYGATGNTKKLIETYKLSIDNADSCKIEKYKLYSTEMMKLAYERLGNYKQAFLYTKLFDSLKDKYSQQEHLNKMAAMQYEYDASKKEKLLIIEQKSNESYKRFIAILLALICILFLSIILYIQLQRKIKLFKEKAAAEEYTKMLLQKTEDDRKRIATNLHDSISHELLNLKSSDKSDHVLLNSNIDNIIEDIRIITRNLHPIMFDKVGLRNTVEQMVERVQQQNKFMLTAEINYMDGLTVPSALQLYRIIQEAVTNMVKYSGAMAGKITIIEKDDEVLVEIKDNGQGFNVEGKLNNGKSFGLHNIIERCRAIGGTSKIQSGINGTVISLKIQKI